MSAPDLSAGEPALEVIDPGLSTTIQDLGRPGWMRVGVPQGGALDREALRLANALVGAPTSGPGALSPGAGGGPAALEIRYLGPSVRAVAGSVRLALVGAEAAMRLERVEDGAPWETIGAWRSVTLGPGDALRVGALKGGSTAVLAVAGGLAAPMALGSRATFQKGGFGGMEGRALRPGDRLALRSPSALAAQDLWIPSADRPLSPARGSDGAFVCRVILGPQQGDFPIETFERLTAAQWTVSRDADRMGVRLEGPELAHRGSRGGEMLSEGVVEGAIQVPAGGQPIVLLADRGATGGYPKIAVVASVDLPLFARLSPGDRLRFAPVTPDVARQALLDRDGALRAAMAAVEPFRPPGVINEDKLWAGNLITAQAPGLFDD